MMPGSYRLSKDEPESESESLSDSLEDDLSDGEDEAPFDNKPPDELD